MKLPVKYDEIPVNKKYIIRNAYVKEQDGKCFYCEGDLKEEPSDDIKCLEITPRLYPQGFFNHPVHLHHCHKTGMTLGAVHNYCNAVLWEYHGE